MFENVFRTLTAKNVNQDNEPLEVVRVLAQKCNGLHQPESRKFSFDPKVTSHMVLRVVLLKAFNITGEDFAVSYLSKDEKGRDVYLALLSDLDLKLAVQHSAYPFLRLKVDCSPFSTKSNCLDDWDIIQSSDVSYHRNTPFSPGISESTGLLHQFTNNPLEKFQKALHISDKADERFKYLVPPLKDEDFHKFQDDEGRLQRPEELRLLIYQIGIEHSLRKVVWKHLLNVFPANLTGSQRFDYMKKKCAEYEELKKQWQDMRWDDKKQVVSSIRKDVLRTDRSHAFYTDIEVDFDKTPTNPHLTSLFDILMTFAMSFPQISYCQGMSDLASPILLIMDNEAVTYVCFCAMMKRLRQNFAIDSRAMRVKFDHLKLLLRYLDQEFYDYLSNGVDNFELFFCYRWLLLEMKREFALDDALLMLEVMWASIPPDAPDVEVHLTAASSAAVQSPTTSEASSGIPSTPSGHLNSLDAANSSLLSWSEEQNKQTPIKKAPSSYADTFDHLSNTSMSSINDNAFKATSKSSPKVPNPIPNTDSAALSNGYTDSSLNAAQGAKPSSPSQTKKGSSCGESPDNSETSDLGGTISSESTSVPNGTCSSTLCVNDSASNNSPSSDLKRAKSNFDISPNSRKNANNVFQWDDIGSANNSSCAELASTHDAEIVHPKNKITLPCPAEFGYGNPFLLFMCVSLILQQKQNIMSKKLDFTETSAHFYKLVRSHDVHKVLGHARMLFADYLRTQPWKLDSDC